MEYSLIYSTASSNEEAYAIGSKLVEGRLAACVNILDGMRSIYRWDNAIQEGSEVVLIAKTKTSLVPELITTIQNLHSYECPAIVAVPITAGSADYLAWIEKETA